MQARLIAGRIIPALATTTSMVTGFVCLELIKYLQNPEKAVFKDLQVVIEAFALVPSARRAAFSNVVVMLVVVRLVRMQAVSAAVK